MRVTIPKDEIEKFKSQRIKESDDEVLDELRAFAALPDESDEAWELDETWQRMYLLTALADIIGERRLENGIGLVLDKMCYGDPGEMMHSMRHSLERAVDRGWNRLASICVDRCASDRAGTRLWAVTELGVLREPSSLPTILRLFDDGDREVTIEAMQAARMMLESHSELRPRVMEALRRVGDGRRDLRDDALRHIRKIQHEAPKHGRIAEPDAEARLAEAVRQYRASSNERAVADAVEHLLYGCLRDCDEWDGIRTPDGVLTRSLELTSSGVLELRGHLIWLPDSAIDPISASIRLDSSQQAIEKASLALGDADIGLSVARHGGPWPDVAQVKRWVFIFDK